MASPIGSPKNQGNGDQQFKAQVQAWIREEIANARRGGVGLYVDGATGDLVAADGKKVRSGNFVPGSSGWGLNPNGNAEFNDLTLRGGIIGNDALTNPLSGGTFNATASGFGLTTTLTVLGYTDVAVPAGFSRLQVTGVAMLFSYNNQTTGGSNGAGGDALYTAVGVASQNSDTYPVGVSGSGGFGSTFSGASFTLTGLTSGSNVRLSVLGASAYQSLAANASNKARAAATFLWLR